MRIVVDMQGAQSTGSRHRGIGRYTRSLVAALLKQRSSHQIFLAFNGFFAEAVRDITAEYGDLLPAENWGVWYSYGFEARGFQEHSGWCLAAEATYEAFLLSLRPDVILITSLFEGLDDPAVTSIHRYQVDVPVAVVLYDLIPYNNPRPYLENELVRVWYQEKIQHLKRADLLLSISEYSRQEVIETLEFDTTRVVNIASDADAHFTQKTFPDQNCLAVRQRFGLIGDFVMYTGGADYRKNIEGLLRAYAKVPLGIRHKTQLAIVCALPEQMQHDLLRVAKALNLNNEAVVFTGYVSDEQLALLYHLCSVFVFPSFHEGFGLPALEAIRCGAPVIGSDRSSIPEVLGWSEALFDPYCIDSMNERLTRALTDHPFRTELRKRQSAHATQFSWDESAKRALAAIESRAITTTFTNQEKAINLKTRKPKLAFFSPLPPSRSGIADYSAVLLPALMEYYDIDVIVQGNDVALNARDQGNISIRSLQWFTDNFERFDRIIYQFGNSTFHQHMFDWIEKLPGVVVLHDFFLSGILAHTELYGDDSQAWTRALYDSHGYKAVRDRFTQTDHSETIFGYPANLTVLQQALGTIVHTHHSCALAQQWYGESSSKDWQIIPFVRARAERLDKLEIKRELGFSESDLIVCSFGMVSPTKLNSEIVNAWHESIAASNPKAHLIFVGENDPGPYGADLSRRIHADQSAGRISITGWLEPETYTKYLTAADIAIQLRTNSRGETSAAVMDCMNYGVATIVNAHGSMQELEQRAVKVIPDRFDQSTLAQAITQLVLDPQLRQAYGDQAHQIIANQHGPETCARRYFEVIEGFYRNKTKPLTELCRAISQLNLDDEAIVGISSRLSQTFPPYPRKARILIDVTTLCIRSKNEPNLGLLKQQLLQWQEMLSDNFRVEPVYADLNTNRFRFAEKMTCQALGIPGNWAEDPTVEPWPGDFFITFESCTDWLLAQKDMLLDWHNRIGNVWLVVKTDGSTEELVEQPEISTMNLIQKPWANLLDVVTGLVCETPEQMARLQTSLNNTKQPNGVKTSVVVGRPPRVDCEPVPLATGLRPMFSDVF